MKNTITIAVFMALTSLPWLASYAAEAPMRCGSGMSMKAEKPVTDMPGMDMTDTGSGTGMNMEMNMQGGLAPADARDPHAFADGYTLDPNRPLKLHDESSFGMLGFDRLERIDATEATTAYTAHAWYGRNYDKLVFISEGDVVNGKLEESMSGLYWGHAVDIYWDTHLGVRHDTGIGPNRNWLAAGVQGLAPYWFEIRAMAYVGHDSRTALSLEAEYELLLTQRLILQPALEINAYGKRDVENAMGSGLADVTAGLRLRYEFTRQFAPYVGIETMKLYGETADMAQVMTAPISDSRWVAGLRFWF